MAHADYECCCVCDRKMAHNEMAAAKTKMCRWCVARLRKILAKEEIDGEIKDPEGFLELISSLPKDRLETLLKKIKFRACRYPNPIDDYLESVFGEDYFHEKFRAGPREW